MFSIKCYTQWNCFSKEWPQIKAHLEDHSQCSPRASVSTAPQHWPRQRTISYQDVIHTSRLLLRCWKMLDFLETLTMLDLQNLTMLDFFGLIWFLQPILEGIDSLESHVYIKITHSVWVAEHFDNLCCNSEILDRSGFLAGSWIVGF